MFSAVNLYAQGNAVPDLKNIQSIEQANALVEDFPDLKASVYTFNAKTDTFPNNKKLLKSRKGDIVKIENITYKILDTGAMKIFRVSYIYFDGSQLSLRTVNSFREKIIRKYKKGILFETLAKQYTMDGNTTGDTGYFGENIMVPEFESAVRQHEKGDLFTVDIPSLNWYFIVKKTYADQTFEGMKVLVIPDL